MNTPWEKEIGDEKTNFRFNIITMLVYVIGIVLIAQLFNLQVVNGETYREQSNTRLSRVSSIQAARGSILDRSGNEFAGVKTQNNEGRVSFRIRGLSGCRKSSFFDSP